MWYEGSRGGFRIALINWTNKMDFFPILKKY